MEITSKSHRFHACNTVLNTHKMLYAVFVENVITNVTTWSCPCAKYSGIYCSVSMSAHILNHGTIWSCVICTIQPLFSREIHWIGGWVAPEPVWTFRRRDKSLLFVAIWTSNRVARSLVTIPLSVYLSARLSVYLIQLFHLIYLICLVDLKQSI